MNRIVEIKNFSEEQDLINRNDMCVIFFGSETCGHCHEMVKPFQSLAAKYRNVAFGHVDIGQVESTDVDHYPVFAMYKNQYPRDSLLGADPSVLDIKLQKLMY